MAYYSVSLIGTPTSDINLESRTYRVRFRICTNGSVCDLYPAKINSLMITYPLNPCGGVPPTKTPIPAYYDLGFWGCEDEVDAGAVLSSSSLVDEAALPSKADLDELAALITETGPAADGAINSMLGTDGSCVVCRYYDFTYEAKLVDGKTAPEDIAENACPEITIEPYVNDKPVNKATFRGFWRPSSGCTNQTDVDIEDFEVQNDGWALLRSNNTPVSCDDEIDEAALVLQNSIENAQRIFLAKQADCWTQHQVFPELISYRSCVTTALLERDQAIEAALAIWRAVKDACFDAAPAAEPRPCWDFISGQYTTPRLPNGTLINITDERTEEVITIRHYALDLGNTDLFRAATNTVNCFPFGITIPCQNFTQVWPARTLYLRFVRHNSTTLNGVRMWQREYQFHYSPDGWDEFVKNEGVERAVCTGAPTGKFIEKPDQECDFDDLLVCDDACGKLPSTASIIDHLGHPIRDPIPLDFNGQPICGQPTSGDQVENFTRWETKCCFDFSLLPIPQVQDIDEERDGNTPPGGPTAPTVGCSLANENGEWKVFYKGDQCLHTFTCTNSPPYQWVLTSSTGENCP